MTTFSANPDSLTAIKAAFLLFEQRTNEGFTAFSRSASRSAPLLDAKTRAELTDTLSLIDALTASLVRYSSENVLALTAKLDCLAEMTAVMRK